MHNTIKKAWFSQPTRNGLAKFVDEQLEESILNMIDFQVYDQSEKDTTYQTSVLGAWVTVMQLIRYIGVDPTAKRPWVAHKRIKQPLELNQFKEYIDGVVNRLSGRPPSENYAALVHIHTVINFLTTMEYQDGR